jgi:serine/threonine protein kinase
MNSRSARPPALYIQDIIADQPLSTVYEVKDAETGETYAVKIPKQNCTQVAAELSLLQKLSHPSIIPVRSVQTPNGSGLAMPFAHGGDLLSWIQSHPLDEDTVKGIIFNLLHALASLHEQQIWHRDVKPENLLVMDHTLSPDCVFLADFGLAGQFPNGVCDSEFPGSLEYAAPELLRGDPYNEKVDVWALGMTMYACLTSALPFEADPAVAREEILAGLPGLFESEQLEVSEECRSLLDWMLAPDPERRPSAEEALRHVWFGERLECRSENEVRKWEDAAYYGISGCEK